MRQQMQTSANKAVLMKKEGKVLRQREILVY